MTSKFYRDILFFAFGHETRFKDGDPQSDNHKPFNPIVDNIKSITISYDPKTEEVEEMVEYKEGFLAEYNQEPVLCTDLEFELISEGYESPDEDHKKRKCFNPKCNKNINFFDFACMNDVKYSSEQLKKIWNSPYVELYCCTCFRKQNLFEKQVKKEERLLRKAKRINRKFGFELE